MRKRRREGYHGEEEERYSLPISKAKKKKAHSATFKPNIDEFRIITTEAPPTNQTNYDVKRKSGYKTLFASNHLQVINTLFSSDNPQTIQDNDVNKESQELVEEAKGINTTVKKATPKKSKKSQMKKDEEDNDIEEVDVNEGEIDISGRRLSKLKGRLKWIPYTQKRKHQ
ncbi:hypothetical protein HPULCUR_006954 [Helicostylum pulchrum]|uniref:Uncharacterized protein n=1 Tax=Helicostylum pulchrum TaxID=562976 RepID=A0ABP9Y3H9_9FUNG